MRKAFRSGKLRLVTKSRVSASVNSVKSPVTPNVLNVRFVKVIHNMCVCVYRERERERARERERE